MLSFSCFGLPCAFWTPVQKLSANSGESRVFGQMGSKWEGAFEPAAGKIKSGFHAGRPKTFSRCSRISVVL